MEATLCAIDGTVICTSRDEGRTALMMPLACTMGAAAGTGAAFAVVGAALGGTLAALGAGFAAGAALGAEVALGLVLALTGVFAGATGAALLAERGFFVGAAGTLDAVFAGAGAAAFATGFTAGFAAGFAAGLAAVFTAGFTAVLRAVVVAAAPLAGALLGAGDFFIVVWAFKDSVVAGAAAARAAGFLAGDFTARLLWVPVGCVSAAVTVPPGLLRAAGDSASARECTGKPNPSPIH